MGTVLTLLALGGLGGLGWWVATRDEEAPPPPRPEAPPLALPPPPPAELPALPVRASAPPVRASEPKGEQPNGTRYVAPRYVSPPAVAPVAAPPVSLAPSDFVHRMRRWLEQSPPPTQIELVAVNLERAGHRETATQLRALASDRRRAESASAPEAAPADPPEPASPPSASDGSPESSPESASANSSNTGGGSVAPSAPSVPRTPAGAPASSREVQALARRVAAMLRAREGQGTDRRLVRQFQVAARVFPARGENPSGLYGPATREALARFGVRNPPRPRFRASVEAGPPRTSRSNAPARRRARGPSAPRTSTNRPAPAR